MTKEVLSCQNISWLWMPERQATDASFSIKRGKCAVSPKENSPNIFPHPGWVEHDADEIWACQLGVAVEAMNKIGASAEDIAAIGITNQRETAIVWDRKTGEPVYNAIVWQCRRTSEYCDSLKEKGLTEKFRQKTRPPCGLYHREVTLRFLLPSFVCHTAVPRARLRTSGGIPFYGLSRPGFHPRPTAQASAPGSQNPQGALPQRAAGCS